MDSKVTDEEIKALPDWPEALNNLVADYEQEKLKEPSEWQREILAKILISRYRSLGYLVARLKR
jgi:hypothetical protein